VSIRVIRDKKSLSPLQAYALKLAERLGGASPVFLYWKGRVALYALLQAMGVKLGDGVILPAYTCVVVLNAIFYAGALPVYVDVRPDTYCLDPDKLEEALTDRTKVILCQNTYGLSADVEKVVEIARRRGIYTIEDCAHGFGGAYQGKANGTFCDAAFFSTQWNKPFSTGLGGFAVVNNQDLIPKVEALEKEKQQPTLGETSLLRQLIRMQRWLVRDWSYWNLVALYRWLSRYNLILGSSQGGELDDIAMPKNYLKGLSAVQAREGLHRPGPFGRAAGPAAQECRDLHRFPGREGQEPRGPRTFSKPQLPEISPAGQQSPNLPVGGRKGPGPPGRLVLFPPASY